jgi:hypothetical protein
MLKTSQPTPSNLSFSPALFQSKLIKNHELFLFEIVLNLNPDNFMTVLLL